MAELNSKTRGSHIVDRGGWRLLQRSYQTQDSPHGTLACGTFLERAGGGAEAMQCHDVFGGAKLPRSNQKRGQQASKHDIN